MIQGLVSFSCNGFISETMTISLQGKHLLAEVITKVFSVIKLEKIVKKSSLQHLFVGSGCFNEVDMELRHN